MAAIEQAMSLLKELGYMNVLHEESDGNPSANVQNPMCNSCQNLAIFENISSW